MICVVQLQAPLLVQTKMTSIVAGPGKRRRCLLQRLHVPTSEEYARAAARWIGHGPLCMPNLGHRLQWRLCRVVPDRLLDAQRLRENLRQRAVFQRLRSSRAPSQANGGEQS